MHYVHSRALRYLGHVPRMDADRTPSLLHSLAAYLQRVGPAGPGPAGVTVVPLPLWMASSLQVKPT
jgi:hypothetical protein